jgi:hypothetical protein
MSVTTTELSLFEEFMLRFATLKNVAKGHPSRVSNFYKESKTIRNAVEAMESFLVRNDFERSVFHGPKKHFPHVPANFEREWKEYRENWADKVSSTYFKLHEITLEMLKAIPDGGKLASQFQKLQATAKEAHDSSAKLERALTEEFLKINPDIKLGPNERIISSIRFGKIRVGVTDNPEEFGLQDGWNDPDKEFDPKTHDGAYLIEELISYLRELIEKDDKLESQIATDMRVSLGAYDYLTETIGLDVSGIFRRWKSVPITFMPSHVSKKVGQTEKGSLDDLLNDAVRAFVCGAPAAAIAMCRAALEMVLKRHYGKDAWDDLKLADIIALASRRYGSIPDRQLLRLNRDANKILHNYSARNRMSEKDERTILEFIGAVKFLIQRAPNPGV